MQLVVFRYFAHHLGLNSEAQEAARQLRSRVMRTGLDLPPGFNPGTGFRTARRPPYRFALPRSP